MLTAITENLELDRVPHDKTWCVKEKQKQITDCIASINNGDNPIKPNLILERQKQKFILLKWANYNIVGFPIGKTPTKEYKIKSLEWVRDKWLEEEANQELVFQKHTEMTQKLRQARKKDSEEVVH